MVVLEPFRHSPTLGLITNHSQHTEFLTGLIIQDIWPSLSKLIDNTQNTVNTPQQTGWLVLSYLAIYNGEHGVELESKQQTLPLTITLRDRPTVSDWTRLN